MQQEALAWGFGKATGVDLPGEDVSTRGGDAQDQLLVRFAQRELHELRRDGLPASRVSVGRPNPREGGAHLPWSRVPEQPAQSRHPLRLGDECTVQAEAVMARDTLDEAEQQGAQAVAARQGWRRRRERARRTHGFHQCDHEGLLRPEMAVDGLLSDTGLGGDVVHRPAGKSIAEENRAGAGQDGGALGGIKGATGPGGQKAHQLP